MQHTGLLALSSGGVKLGKPGDFSDRRDTSCPALWFCV